MCVSENRGIPKWMVKIMENPYEQMDDFGGKPTIFGNTIFISWKFKVPPPPKVPPQEIRPY